MRGIPLLLGARPVHGLKGPNVPIYSGEWRIHSNNLDSRVVIIVDTSPFEIQRYEVKDRLDIKVEGKGKIFAEVLDRGNEDRLDIHLERL